MPRAFARTPAIAGTRAFAGKLCTGVNGPVMGGCAPKFKFEFFALALTGSIRPELMAEGSSDPTLRAGPQFPRCLLRGMNSNLIWLFL
jgi:hypothetical protein